LEWFTGLDSWSGGFRAEPGTLREA
jgi:hypothetical protein